MEVSSLTFLYIFLPAALILFNLVSKKFKSAVLAAVSLCFLWLSQPDFFLLFAGFILLQFGISETMFRFEEKAKNRKFLLFSAIFLNAAAIVFSSVKSQLSGGFAPFAAMVVSFTAIGYFVYLY